MNELQLERRRAKRRPTAMDVRFSINGGSQIASDSINFTHKSIAIRSNAKVKQGDHIAAWVDDLPCLEGEVIRVWEDGFAAILSAISLALIASANTHSGDQQDSGAHARPATRTVSAHFPLIASHTSWARIASSTDCAGKSSCRHDVSVITTAPLATSGIKSVWLSVDDTRWAARLLLAGCRKDIAIIILQMNGWQLHMAARHGFSASVIFDTFEEWVASAQADPINIHLRKIAPEVTSNELRAKTVSA